MKKIALFILLIAACDNNMPKSKYYSILSNYSTSQNFISVVINNGKEEYPIVIENASLYNILKKADNIKKVEYEKKLVRLHEDNKPLKISLKTDSLVKIFRIFPDPIIDSLAQKLDKEEFINKFFDKNILNEHSFSKRQSILYHAFKKEIFCHRQCESGNIVLDSNDVLNPR